MLTQSPETLSALQWAHLTHIPYENLNISAIHGRKQDRVDNSMLELIGEFLICNMFALTFMAVMINGAPC